jgi:hypothetical protein
MKQLELHLVDEMTIAQHVFEYTSGHPNIVQRLCRRLIDQLGEKGVRVVTLDDVVAITQDRSFQSDDLLSTFWEAASPLEKIISLLMADDEDVRTLGSVRQALEMRCDIRPMAREVDDALQSLVTLRSILRHTQSGYEFAVQALPRVMARTTTLDDLLVVMVEEYQEQSS